MLTKKSKQKDQILANLYKSYVY